MHSLVCYIGLHVSGQKAAVKSLTLKADSNRYWFGLGAAKQTLSVASQYLENNVK